MSLVGFTLLGSIEAPTLTGAATGVPLLVKPNTEFTAAMLASLDVGGGDLRFSSDTAGLNQLPCEIVDGLDVVWVKPTGVSISTGATLYVWGDNTGASQPAVGDAFGRNAVWSDFEFASHSLSSDSTGNAGAPVAVGGVSIGGSTSPIGGATDFDGVDDVVNYGNTASVSTNVSISALVNLDTYGENVSGNLYGRIVRKGGNYDFLSANDTTTTATVILSSARASANSISLGTWLQLDATINSSGDVEFYVNGTSAGSATGYSIGATNSDNLSIGNFDTTNAVGRHTNGKISEVRISQSVKSPNQISIEYDNQSEPNAWWIASDAGGISITESVVNSNYVSLDPAILLTGSISVTESLVNTNYAAVNPTVTLTGSISITESIVNANYTSLNPVIDLTGIVSVAESLVNSNYISLDPVINLTSGAIEIIESTAGTQYAVFNPSILLTPEPLGIVSTVCFNGELADLNYSGQSVILEFSGQLETTIFNGEFNALDFSGTIQTTCADGDIKTNC